MFVPLAGFNNVISMAEKMLQSNALMRCIYTVKREAKRWTAARIWAGHR